MFLIFFNFLAALGFEPRGSGLLGSDVFVLLELSVLLTKEIIVCCGFIFDFHIFNTLKIFISIN
jgi:hypothetical protein